jgi:hypothetical protein
VSLDAYLPDFRADAEERMGADAGACTVQVRRKTGETTTDADGYEVDEWVVELAEVPCRIGSDRGASQSRTVSTPGGDVTLAVRVAHFPAATEGLRDGDFIEVVDGRLLGSVWRIVEADDADQQTARRVPVVAAERPSEWAI